MSQKFALPAVRTSSSLEVQKYPPILTAEEEHALAIELYENHDLSAARKLVLSHMRFVAFIAHGYKGYGLEQADLIQEGTIGLMKAVKRFNPHKNVRLASGPNLISFADILNLLYSTTATISSSRMTSNVSPSTLISVPAN